MPGHANLTNRGDLMSIVVRCPGRTPAAGHHAPALIDRGADRDLAGDDQAS